MTPDLSVSREINAAPASVFAALTDITRMGEWSPECHTCTWNEGSSAPVLDAMFTGQNRNDDKEWTTESKIVDLEQDARFFFDCMVGDFVFAKWGYEIAATSAGCTVTEHWQDLRPEAALERSKVISGVEDRVSHNQAGMEATLARLAAAVEQ